MHPEMVKLLDLQSKDSALDEIDRRLAGIADELGELERALETVRAAADAARRALADGIRRRDELEAKVENYRTLQERRRQRLEFVRNPKEAASLMAELDLAKSVLAKEESEWVRAAESIAGLERRVAEEEARVAEAEEAQRPAREELAARRAALEAERSAVEAEREASAAQIERTLRIRYDRLRRARARAVVVPLRGGACSACNTAIPLSRRTQIRTGAVVDGCEVCGAILYAADGVGAS